MWSVLGTIYSSTEEQDKCFKEAINLSGEHTAFIKEWHFLGPFGVGKVELDGDPIEAYGGIRNVSKYRMQKTETFYSELLPAGEVTWEIYRQRTQHELMPIYPNVNFRDLANSLGSMAITEWQGWLIGDFAVNVNNMNFIVQCLGVSTVYIDGRPHTGDLYRRNDLKFSVSLTRGIHTLYIKLRAKVSIDFMCSLSTDVVDFEVLPPTFLPDLYDGYIFGRYISISVANYHPTQWVKKLTVSVLRQSGGETLNFRVVKNEMDVAPGQIKPVILRIMNKAPNILSSCSDIDLELLISTSVGEDSVSFTIRCRNLKQSVIFTFLDHDGSVQHGAAVHPIKSCPGNICPIVLTLHGTSVPAQNQADSYKKMVGKEFQFGVKKAWLVAPTRHGAHNWEGPGALTAMKSITALSDIVQDSDWLTTKADVNHVIYAGHSMGGHGAWHLAVHYPDRALAVISLAGWINKEEYGDSNLLFKFDLSTSHVETAVKSIMEMCISENYVDRHVSNLQGIPVLSRTGADDKTSHPYFSRRMYRLLKEYNIAVNYTELASKDHWWWDTVKRNDGGVVNDLLLRKFMAKYISVAFDDGTCSVSGDCGEEADSMYQRSADRFTLTTINPALGEGLRGVRILQQIVPYRVSTIDGNVTDDTIFMTTKNVRRFRIVNSTLRKIPWSVKTIQVDGSFTVNEEMLTSMDGNHNSHLCKQNGSWQFCNGSIQSYGERGISHLGPARRVAESSFIIVYGTQGEKTDLLLTLAVYIANQFYLTSDTSVGIKRDVDIAPEELDDRNVILLGHPLENLHTEKALDVLPINVEEDSIIFEDCIFNHARTGVLTLAPNGPDHLTLLLMGLSEEGIIDIVSLATPTIPPMARSPFSNLIPDYVVTGPDFGWKGPGGFLCIGFYGNKWEYRSDLSSCVCLE